MANVVLGEVDFQVVAVELGDVQDIVDIAREAVGRYGEACEELGLVTFETADQLLLENVEVAADDRDGAA